MFGKLLKYDFRSMFKQFAFIWPAALALALVNHFTVNGLDSTSTVGETTAGVSMLVYVAILMAMFIVALVFAIQRFYRGLLGDEGYLMHTLPVKPWQLIGAKLLCAVVTTFLSVVVAILSVLVIVPWSLEDLQVLFKGFQYLFGHWDLEVTRAFLGLLELLLLMLVSSATGFLQLYLAMSVGHLFNKNRVAMSVVAFIAINAVMSTLLSTVVPGLDPIIRPLLNGQSGQSLYHRSMWLAIAGELVLSAIYFAGTEFILRKKLNLE